MFDKLLGTLLGADEGTRVELVQVAAPGEAPTLEIRLLQDAGALGWQIFRRIRVASGQVGALRDALNMMDLDARAAQPRSNHLRLVDFDEAL